MFYLESDKLASLAHKANIVQVFETHVIQLTTYYFLGILQLLVPGEREENMYEISRNVSHLPIQRTW